MGNPITDNRVLRAALETERTAADQRADHEAIERIDRVLGRSAPPPTPEAQALQAKAAEQRQIAANMRAQATADKILETLPTDPTPDDHDAVAEKLEVAANEVKA